ncbi:DUF6538 domain-containing protein [Bradyrhizobium liaoningense]|uniref:DUF6538 domain-containing protein n=1 Tax=Bradyrhizobium liaoningense TaxID=43992 RepID=UPI00289813C5|nr:DUF6538 domain-containing protein [Bradyrhizobium liaoningense]
MALSRCRPRKHPVTGVYYFRKIVPADVRARLGKREWKVSLETNDPAEACRRHAVEHARVLQELETLRRRNAALSAPPMAQPDTENIKQVGEAYYVHLPEEDVEQRVAGLLPSIYWPSPRQDRLSFERAQEVVEKAKDVLRRCPEPDTSFAARPKNPFRSRRSELDLRQARSRKTGCIVWNGSRDAPASLARSRTARSRRRATHR